jgi:hypothetical protein
MWELICALSQRSLFTMMADGEKDFNSTASRLLAIAASASPTAR